MARILVGCYPPSWRARYAPEMLALLADTGLSVRRVANVVGAAAVAWVRPARHLHNPPARIRASLSVVFGSWTELAAAALLFGQLYEDESLAPATPGHPITAGLYHFYVAAAHVSVGILAVATLPLAVLLLRAAIRRRAYGEIVLLTLPATASLGFLGLLITLSHATRHAGGGLSSCWFLALTALGLVAGAAVAAGPIAVLRRQRPTGRLVVFASLGAGVATVTMAAATAAAAANAIAIDAWTTATMSLHAATPTLAGYAAFVVVVSATAFVSMQRGARAMRAASAE
jgi:energy-converting hydrogenase Eha subunit C